MQTWISENWFSALSIIAIIIGGIFALLQYRKSIQLRRAEFLNQIIEKLRFDDEIVKTMYTIDYDQNWYNESFHESGEKEFLMDKLLSYLSYICYLISQHNITKDESSILEYELRRVCESKSVQSYLFNLYHFSKHRNSLCSFEYLINYGHKEKIISDDFFDIQNPEFTHYLNF
ncbi:MAG: hypothetical protein LBL87_02530 [Ruminococcus sp.]|jgi:hypothetical protein|nr:hypothetical protein [Ruminococcus sp.]